MRTTRRAKYSERSPNRRRACVQTRYSAASGSLPRTDLCKRNLVVERFAALVKTASVAAGDKFLDQFNA